jgi:phenylalanyl-tRNA synthetase beta chain
MKLLPTWLREFVDVPVDDAQLATDLTAAGIAVEGITTEGPQTVYEVEITPNRVDAMSHYGVARDAAAFYDKDLKPLAPQLPTTKDQRPTTPSPIIIQDAQGCARYTARVIRDVKIGPSPSYIAKRLEALGSRTINNAADATNYTLQEMGHPTHAFDLDLLAGGKIIVRRARPGEKLKTLDGVDRTLHPDDLVIADAEKAVAIAGVMGGFDSMITEKTRNVLIESAWFDPASVRRTAKRHGVHTDASHRFERGADWGATLVACDRVAELILASAGGQPEGGQIDAIGRKLEQHPITLRRSEVRRHLGQDIPEQEIARILRRLGFDVTHGRAATPHTSTAASPAGSGGAHAAIAEDVDSFTVAVPTWRLDVEREIDLIEEVARIYGYNRFPNTLPAFSGSVIELPDAAKEARVRSTVLALGYNEAISLTFISKTDAETFARATPVEIANPLSDEAAFMRTSLVPGMLDMLAWNLNRGVHSARLFEAGHVYELAGDQSNEQRYLCIGATGDAVLPSVHQSARPYTFFDLKGDVETLLGAFQHGGIHFDASTPQYYHPGRSARAVMDGAQIDVARFGELNPDVASARKLRQPVFIAELLLDRLYQQGLRQPRFTAIPRFPAVERDFSFVFENSLLFERVWAQVNTLGIAEMRSFTPVEVFRGGSVPPGKYSVLLRATFQSPERTLRDDEVALWSSQIIEALESLGGTLRA